MNPWKILALVGTTLQIILLGFIFVLTNRVNTLSQELELPYIPIEDRNVSVDIASSTEEGIVIDTTIEDEIPNSPSVFQFFTDLLTSIAPPNTELQDNLVSITGDLIADDVINALAEDAGYVRQPNATTTLVAIEGKLVHPEVKVAWQLLKSAGLAEEINLGIVSGYRSPEAQRSLFVKYFKEETKEERNKDFTAKEIRDGLADAAIIRTLTYAAPPGYSRHHTGYTIDIRDINSGFSFYEFGKTNGYKWVSKNNYLNARTYGFIPSYARGERDGGPEPEPWELVWIGSEHIKSLSGEVLGEVR